MATFFPTPLHYYHSPSPPPPPPSLPQICLPPSSSSSSSSPSLLAPAYPRANQPRILFNYPSRPHVSASVSLHPVVHKPQHTDELPSSAMAVAAAVGTASPSAVEFSQTADKDLKGFFSGPSPEFLALCEEQLSLCDRMFGHNAKMTVYVRTADSYGTGHLELRRAAAFPRWTMEAHTEVSLLVGKFQTTAALRTAEAALAEQDVVELPGHKAVVLPLAKDLFLVGLLVAEWMVQPAQRDTKHIRMRQSRPSWPPAKGQMQSQKVRKPPQSAGALDSSNNSLDPRTETSFSFTSEQRMASAKVARSLAMACIMDQRTLLLQQSSWQMGVQIGELVEQVRGPLAAIRTLGKMLQPQLKRGEISSDLVDDILVQGDRMKDVVQQLQEQLFLTTARPNQLNYNELNRNGDKGSMNWDSQNEDSGTITAQSFDLVAKDDYGKQKHPKSMILVGHSPERDTEAPMPPHALTPLRHMDARPCDVLKLLIELVHSGIGLAHQKGQTLELKRSPSGVSLLAAIDESALRQALGSLLDSSLQLTLPHGWVKVEAMQAPGGGVLVVIDNNGPDFSLMTQCYALSPLGTGWLANTDRKRIEFMLANVAAKYRVAQDILEQFGGILRITSPYVPNSSVGVGGTRLEVWLPTLPDQQGT